MDKNKEHSHKTETIIDGVVYIVESVSADAARDTMYSKVKKLILDHAKVSENSKVS